MKNTREFVADYVTQQLALESHTLSVVEAQLEDVDVIEMPIAFNTLIKVKAILQTHVSALHQLTDTKTENSVTKISASVAETITDVTGAIIGIYNKLRSEKVSKMLRDDYAALSLASLTYSMLFVTARGLGENKTAEVASRHLRDIPPLVMELNSIVPEVVAIELKKLGFSVNANAESEAISESKAAWSQH